MKVFVLTLLILAVSVIVVIAQPDVDPPPPEVPINSSLAYLIAAGSILGLKKLVGTKKE